MKFEEFLEKKSMGLNNPDNCILVSDLGEWAISNYIYLNKYGLDTKRSIYRKQFYEEIFTTCLKKEEIKKELKEGKK